jgi:hypothetical protein
MAPPLSPSFELVKNSRKFCRSVTYRSQPHQSWLGIKFPWLRLQCRTGKVPWTQLGSVPISVKDPLFLYKPVTAEVEHLYALRPRGQGMWPLTKLFQPWVFLNSADTQRESDEVFEVWKAEKGPTFMPQSHGQWVHDYVYSTGALCQHIIY